MAKWVAMVLVVLGVAMAVAGCAKPRAKRVFLPDGQRGFSVQCSGGKLAWGSCYERAGALCGRRGYEVVEKSSDMNAAIAANQYAAYGSASQSRSMLVKCKG